MLCKNNVIILTVGLLALILSCKNKISTDEKPVAKVNDYVITQKVFRQELADSARFHDICGLALEDKKNILREQIRKELLIQAAISRGLDREEAFRRAIEKYWEQTLIRALIKRQCDICVEEGIIVTKDEIESRYRRMSRSNPNLPSLEQLLPKLEKEIRDEKQTRALDKWVEDLWKNAEIAIYEENLRAMR